MTVLAHVAGMPVEETVAALVPVLAAFLWALPRPRWRPMTPRGYDARPHDERRPDARGCGGARR